MEKQIEEIKDCIDSVYGCDCAYFGVDGLAIAAAIYNADYRKQEWISVEERLPECENGAETEALLFMTSAGRIEAGYFGRGSVWRDVYFRHYRTCVGWDVSDVTHWMPLPEPPKGDAE